MGHVKKTRQVIVLEVLNCLLQSNDVPFHRDVVFDGNFFLLSCSSRKMGLALFEMTKCVPRYKLSPPSPKQYTHLVWTRHLLRNQIASRRLDAAKEVTGLSKDAKRGQGLKDHWRNSCGCRWAC